MSDRGLSPGTEASDGNDREEGGKKKKRAPSIVTTATVVGTLAAVITAFLTYILVRQQPSSTDSHPPAAPPMVSEEHMVSQLIAGDNYARLMQIIGTQPDTQYAPDPGETIYEFNRTWEYIDLLVKGGAVQSVGVYAKTPSFKATLSAGGCPVTVNGPSLSAQTHDLASSAGAAANSGGQIGNGYYEGFYLPMACEQAAFLLGWELDSRSNDFPSAAFQAGSFNSGCTKYHTYSDGMATLSPGLLMCLSKLQNWRQINDSSPSVVIVVAPGQDLLPEMFNFGPLSLGHGLE